MAVNGKKKETRRWIWAVVILGVGEAPGFGVRAALKPTNKIDPSKLAGDRDAATSRGRGGDGQDRAAGDGGSEVQGERPGQADLCRTMATR